MARKSQDAAAYTISAETLAATLQVAWSAAAGRIVPVTGLMVRTLVRSGRAAERLHTRPAEGSRVHVYTAAEAYAIADLLAARKGAGLAKTLPVNASVLGVARPEAPVRKSRTTRKAAPGGGTIRVSTPPVAPAEQA